MHFFRYLIPAVALIAAGPALALDDDAINNWVDSMEALQTWSEEEGVDDEPIADGTPGDADFEQMLAEAAREYPEAEDIIRDNGFSGADDWANTGSRILNAWMALEASEEAPRMEEEMERQMREIEDNPHISDEQREMMKEQMEQARGMIQGMTEDVPEGDKEAVERNRDRLSAVMQPPQEQQQQQPGQQPPQQQPGGPQQGPGGGGPMPGQ